MHIHFNQLKAITHSGILLREGGLMQLTCSTGRKEQWRDKCLTWDLVILVYISLLLQTIMITSSVPVIVYCLDSTQISSLRRSEHWLTSVFISHDILN